MNQRTSKRNVMLRRPSLLDDTPCNVPSSKLAPRSEYQCPVSCRRTIIGRRFTALR